MTSRRSPIYRSSWLYELAMRALYRRHYRSRYAAVADLIPADSSVVEVCCGPGMLYERHLKSKQVNYTGLDFSPHFVARLRRRNVDAYVWDARDERPLPRADHVVMQASLYQFLPDVRPVIDRMLAAAGKTLVVAEPIHNLTLKD